jgi:pentatricopeptide repeat domain-containing protein 1
MVSRGCERNVITFSSLISACERAGRCDLALRLFDEMRREGCRPNVVTYNGLLGSCAQGAPRLR